MKTKNNVQKAILRGAAVVVSFVLISFTVSAQDFWKGLLENSSFNEIALAMTDGSASDKAEQNAAESLKANFYVTETEPGLELEDWMLRDLEYTVPASFSIVEETEEDLAVESWMMDQSLFLPQVEPEAAIDVEAWMTDELVWKI
jgi:hypothetical protein